MLLLQDWEILLSTSCKWAHLIENILLRSIDPIIAPFVTICRLLISIKSSAKATIALLEEFIIIASAAIFVGCKRLGGPAIARSQVIFEE